MLPYKLVKRENPLHPSAPAKWYASPVVRGRLSIKQLSVEIAASTAVNRGAVESVLISLAERLPRYMLDGISVEIGELGHLRIVFSSEGIEQASDFSHEHINKLRIAFRPAPEFKSMLKKATFVLMK